MYIKYLKIRKKIFFIIKKFYHNNNILFLNFNFLKRIFFKKKKFFNLKCLFVKKKFNFIFYKTLIIKNNFCNINIYIYNNYIFNILIKNSYINIFIFNKKNNFIVNYSKIFLNLLNIKKILVIFKKNNNLFLKKNISKNNLFLIYNIFYYKKNFFLYNLNKKLYNLFFCFFIKNNIYNNKNYLIEIINYKNIYSYIIIYNNLFVKKMINYIFILQINFFYFIKKNFLTINLNITLFTKKIICKHKISFFYFKKEKKKFIKNNIIEKI
ncbi:MAG: hypothetical protein ACH6QM_00495 [Candidatus Carsonella ruddii]